MSRRLARPSFSANPWAGSAPRRRSRLLPSTSRAMNLPSPPAPSTSSTAASASRRAAYSTQEREHQMKLLRYGPPGQEKPGILDRDGRIRDLSGAVSDIGPETLAPTALEKLRKLDPASLPAVTGTPR